MAKRKYTEKKKRVKVAVTQQMVNLATELKSFGISSRDIAKLLNSRNK